MKKIKKRQLLILSVLTLCFSSCTYDSESDLIEVSDDDTDPNAMVNYTDDIATIIQSSCTGCHSSPPVNGAPFALVNFSQVDQRASAMLNRMSRQSGSPGAMPPSGRLPQATIDLVERWIDEGKLEN